MPQNLSEFSAHLQLNCTVKRQSRLLFGLFEQSEDSPSASAAGDANQDPEQSAEALKESIRLAEVCFALQYE